MKYTIHNFRETCDGCQFNDLCPKPKKLFNSSNKCSFSYIEVQLFCKRLKQIKDYNSQINIIEETQWDRFKNG